MAEVQTVRGPVDSADLGRTLAHEHVFVLSEETRINYADDWNEEERIASAQRDLQELKALGIDTILDPTVIGLGRYIPRIQKVAEGTDINIVAATGLYTYNELPFQFLHTGPGLWFDVPDPLIDMFVRDLTEGIGDTGVRAAFLKCAIDEQGLTPGVERAMRAVGAASVQTGAPITVHTDPRSQSGRVVQRVLAEEGVDLTKVVIGHSGDSTDLDYLMELADAGSILGMDRFGLDVRRSFEKRVDTVAQLVSRGYADRMVLAHDAACYIDWYDADGLAEKLPRWHFRHISEDVIPALLDAGVSEADVDMMLSGTVRRYFE